MQNVYRQTKFLLSSPELEKCPEDKGYEVIFIGRSNSGKSSVINTLSDNKKLAMVSKTPGRTRHLVFFSIDKDRRLVDLPGYGYAKISNEIKKTWNKNLNRYLTRRKCLSGAVLIIDSRSLIKPFDQNIINWCVDVNLPTQILLTKADKLSKQKLNKAKLEVINATSKYPNINVQSFSSLKKQGLTELYNSLDAFFDYVD
jgi:GTP-binding protein